MNTSDNILLVIGYVWPEPNSSAAGSNMLSLIRLFREDGWKVHYASPAQRGPHKIDLGKESVIEHDIALNCSSFDEFVKDLSPSMVLYDRFMMEEQFGWRVKKQCPDAVHLLDTEDLHFLRNARHAALKRNEQVTDADLKNELAQREIAAIFRCDLTLIISDYEMNLLQNHFQVPPALLCYCPFLLDQTVLEDTPGFDQREHFVSIGNFRHGPNWDAVLHLKQSIWPAIRRNLPQAELHVYGAYPPPKATQLNNPKQRFHIKGWAPDAQEVVKFAKVLLAPLRFGAGIKGKLTEAMICGTPSITTQIGAEGIQGEHLWPGIVTDSQDEFVEAAVNLYKDKISWEKANQQGYKLLNARFDRQVISARVLKRVNQVRLNLQQHRLDNFIGQMLDHHQHKSTQYFSQWIEAKNKS